MKKSDQIIVKKIKRHGSLILHSDPFRRGFRQTHHKITTVSDHTLNVTITAMKLSRFYRRFRIQPDEKVIIRSALCHDLGIIGRHEKYTGNRECGKKHPVDSLTLARKILSGMDEKTRDAIVHHMWPVNRKKPKFREGMIISFADKWCAAAEWVWHILRYDRYSEMKKEITGFYRKRNK